MSLDEAQALKALNRLTRGGPWMPGERDAAARAYGDWVTGDPGRGHRCYTGCEHDPGSDHSASGYAASH